MSKVAFIAALRAGGVFSMSMRVTISTRVYEGLVIRVSSGLTTGRADLILYSRRAMAAGVDAPASSPPATWRTTASF